MSDDEKQTLFYNMKLFTSCIKLYGINYRQKFIELSKNNENIPNTISKTVIDFYY